MRQAWSSVFKQRGARLSNRRGGRRSAMSPTAFVRRRRKRRLWGTVLVLVIALVLAWLDQRGQLLAHRPDLERFHQRTATVTRVIDGDTLDVLPAGEFGKPTRVRLWGIDTPELAKPSQGLPAEPYAQHATDAARRLAEHKTITLTLEPHRTRGRFGRLLAHVTLDTGQDLAAAQVSAGLARHERRWSHSRYDHLEELDREARRRKVGQWSAAPTTQPP